jgi:hypothetical protein
LQPHRHNAAHGTKIKEDENTDLLWNCVPVLVDWLQMGVTVAVCLPQSWQHKGEKHVMLKAQQF